MEHGISEQDPATRPTRPLLRLGLSIGAVFVVSTALVVVLVLLIDDGDPGRTPVWRWVVGPSLLGASLILMIVSLVRMVRLRRSRERYDFPWQSKSRQERRELRRWVRGEEPTPPDRLHDARAVATMISGQRHLLFLYVGILLNLAGQAVIASTLWRLLPLAVTAVLVSALVPYILFDIRRAEQFLRTHPEPDVGTDPARR